MKPLTYLAVVFASLFLRHAAADAAPCDAKDWIDYEGTSLMTVADGKAYFYVTKRMAIDADGASNAYHPEDKGIDALGNAGYPKGDWKSVLVADPANKEKPYVQSSGEFAGFFVAKTSLEDVTLPVTEPKRYVDSRMIPYIVFPGAFIRLKGTGVLGDVALVRNLDTGAESPAIVADIGPKNAQLGEVSIRLAEKLGGSNINPRNGAGMPKGRFLYVVFPRSTSAPPWPQTEESLKKKSQRLLSEIGGWQRVMPCIK
jgi:hypothetical protein